MRKVAEMCGRAEAAAVHRLARLPRHQRHRAVAQLPDPSADRGLREFLSALIDDELIDDLAAILPKAESPDEAEELLSRLWARLVSMITPQAKDVLYAYRQLQLMTHRRSQEPSSGSGSAVDGPYKSALENARAVLAATGTVEAEEAKDRGA